MIKQRIRTQQFILLSQNSSLYILRDHRLQIPNNIDVLSVYWIFLVSANHANPDEIPGSALEDIVIHIIIRNICIRTQKCPTLYLRFIYARQCYRVVRL